MRSSLHIIFLSFFAISFVASAAQGADLIHPISLYEFEDGLPVPKLNYDDLVQAIAPGTKLQFLDGSLFTITRQLHPQRENEYRMTGVYAVAERDVALRIPLRSLAFDFLRSQAAGYKELKQAGVPVTKIEVPTFGEYLLAEMLPSNWISMEQFLNHKISEEEMQRAEKALLRFAWASAAFSEIGDFNDSQLAFVPSLNSIAAEDKWLLFDWTENHRIWQIQAASSLHLESQHPFSHGFFLNLQRRIAPLHRGWLKNLLHLVEMTILEARRVGSVHAFSSTKPSLRAASGQVNFFDDTQDCSSRLSGKNKNIW